MSKHAFRLAFCFLVLVTPAFFPVQAETAPSLSYSQLGTGDSTTEACADAIQNIKDNCDIYGPITTSQKLCAPIYGPGGAVIGQLFSC
ncbi:MAG TPA: hypothetical protein VFR03_19490 [Thermoanaerobaculia bacterium]|nr:hypothetical protein [Thermoanaerobaculia bacterium]